MSAKPRMKIWIQLLTTIAIALALVWTGVVIWQGHVYHEAALKQARDFSHSMHEATMAGLTGMMVTGTIGQRDVYLDQIQQLGSIRDVRVIRGEAVSRIFGPGKSASEMHPDELEKQVLSSGKEFIEVGRDADGEYLRAIRPTVASSNYLGKNCVACHQVAEGTVLGVVSMKVSLKQVNADAADQRLKSILIAIITSIPVLLLIYPFIQRVVTVPLQTGVQIASDIAQGDLRHDVAVSSSNEIGGLQLALREMVQSLRKVVGRVREGTDSIYTASADIAQGNMDLSNRTESQAYAIERISESMTQLSATVNQNAGNAREASELAAGASDIAARGGEVVTRVVDTMGAIENSSRRISDIINVIDEIAFRTNMLALNAAVEAARAGEQGRGFAVVATEVRALAQRSGEAANEIKALIKESVARVADGSELVQSAGQTMQEIIASTRQVTEIMREIASASGNQTAGIASVSEAIVELNDGTQQNAAMVEQAAAASESLRDQAAELERIVGQFQIDQSRGA